VAEHRLEDSVTFTGRVSDEEIVALHKVGSVYVMPSPAELQSIATLEAMASGQPIVAVDAGALKELCQNERNGYLCEKDNSDQIAAGVTKILSDKALHDRFAAESLAIAGEHDIQTTYDRFESIYSDLINS
jgi:glycosyltransferase involved in cell wall biosynthesis